MGEGNPWRIDAYRKPATTHRRGVPKPVRPFPLISYYWEPSIGFRWKGTRYGIRHYDHREDICRYGTLDQLRDMGVYAIRESLADEILNDLSYDENYAPTDDAKDTIMGTVSAAFEERYGEDFAEVATDFGQDIDDIAGRANPCILSVDTVRAVNEKGYDAVFAEQWKTELSECDIDPEAVSVDSEAHDMENGRDGLDGNAPEKDAPEKDDRDAQPPVDTDNR